MKPETYDDFSKLLPNKFPECDTLLKHFERHVAATPDTAFLGQRPKIDDVDGKPAFGEYVWQSYSQIDKITNNIAQSCFEKDLFPEVDGEAGEKKRFMGIWAKNRWEWTTSLLISMRTGSAVVGFYDAMGVDAVDFIINQTELSSVFVEDQFVRKLIDMKKAGKAKHVKNIINYDNIMDLKDEATENGLELFSWTDM